MSIDTDKPDRQKAYWLSINGKFFKKKLNTHIELVYVSSVKVLSDNIVCIFINSIKNLLFLNISNRYSNI